MESLASETLVQPDSRLVVLGVIPASASAEEAQRTREESALFLKGLESALALQSQKAFDFVERSELVGESIAEEQQKQEATLVQANRWDFLIPGRFGSSWKLKDLV